MAENKAAWRVMADSAKLSTVNKKLPHENKHNVNLLRPSSTQLFVVFRY
jgi:hypothetical protein